MAFPLVYDALLRIEIEGRDTTQACRNIEHLISNHGLEKALHCSFEVIRDDDSFPPKDVHSRHVNGFAVFTSTQKLDLVTKIAAALAAASRGDSKPGMELVDSLTEQFAYLNNSELKGVQV
jgi:hypothetical protein